MRSLLTGPFARGLVGAVAGGLLLLSAVHLWSDHIALHVLVDYMNRNAPKINALPAADPEAGK